MTHADWDGLCDDLRFFVIMPHGQISLNLVLLLLVLEFCDWIQVGIDVYIPHRKYQVNFHSSSWFSVACTAAIVIENIFFIC